MIKKPPPQGSDPGNGGAPRQCGSSAITSCCDVIDRRKSVSTHAAACSFLFFRSHNIITYILYRYDLTRPRKTLTARGSCICAVSPRTRKMTEKSRDRPTFTPKETRTTKSAIRETGTHLPAYVPAAYPPREPCPGVALQGHRIRPEPVTQASGNGGAHNQERLRRASSLPLGRSPRLCFRASRPDGRPEACPTIASPGPMRLPRRPRWANANRGGMNAVRMMYHIVRWKGSIQR